ncbi:MAG: GTPase, partial [Acidimicrobiales bacterium]
MVDRQRRVVIAGAGGRDFHNFNTVFRQDDSTKVVAFTAAQIPGIEGRSYPPSLAGPLYPNGIPIVAEEELADLIAREHVDEVILAYSDLSHVDVMHKASAILAAGPDFRLLGPSATM